MLKSTKPELKRLVKNLNQTDAPAKRIKKTFRNMFVELVGREPVGEELKEAEKVVKWLQIYFLPLMQEKGTKCEKLS